MLDALHTWFANQNFMVSVGMALVAVNLILSGVSALLEKLDEALKGFMDKTVTTVDNAAEAKVSSLIATIGKIVSVLKTATDWLSGNREH